MRIFVPSRVQAGGAGRSTISNDSFYFGSASSTQGHHYQEGEELLMAATEDSFTTAEEGSPFGHADASLKWVGFMPPIHRGASGGKNNKKRGGPVMF